MTWRAPDKLARARRRAGLGYPLADLVHDGHAGVVRAAEEQLAGYVMTRAAQTGQRYVGVLTDGRE